MKTALTKDKAIATAKAVFASEVMRAERKQKDDRNRNADQPKQDGAHDDRLLLVRPWVRMARR
ncbi:MAG: hypothetical protein ACJ8EP_03340 [Sphingomicrobium sp.]